VRSPTIQLLSVRRSLPLFLAVVVCLAVWQVTLTWRLMDQDQNLAAEESRERLEQIADLAVSQLAGALADWELRLRELEALPPPPEFGAKLPAGGFLVVLGTNSVTTYPVRPLLFVPAPASGTPLPAVFDAAEKLEFRDKQYPKAISAVEPLLKNPLTRAEALLRLARIEKKRNHVDAALAAYNRLSQETSSSPEGMPYALLAADARCELARHDGAADQLRAALIAGRWPLRRETFEFYWNEMNRLRQSAEEPPREALEFASLVSRLYNQWPPSMKKEASLDTRQLTASGALLLCHVSPSRLVVLTAPPAWPSQMMKLPVSTRDVGWRWASTESQSTGAAHVLRSLAESQLKGKLDFSIDAAVATRKLNRPLRLTGVVLMLILVIAGAYAIFRGVSRELRVAQLQADFVSSVSHEFRSPLTSLRGITELLSEGRLADPLRRQQSFGFLQRETARLQRLVEDLLDFGRMESGRTQYANEIYDAFTLVRTVVEDFKEEARSYGFQIEMSLDECASTIKADQQALARALRNLLENAVKYSQQCRTVWVDGSVTQRSVAISVRDQGMGIPPAEQREIFQKFVRGSAAKTSGIKGTGIGLSMVRQIIRASGGEIHLDSAVGVGSTFTILLPLAHRSELQA